MSQIGKAFHCQILMLGFECDVILLTGLLEFYAKVGDLVSAKRVFVDMHERDVVANKVRIAPVSKYGHVGEAEKLFDSMPERNSCSWNTMITCCFKVGDVASARLAFD